VVLRTVLSLSRAVDAKPGVLLCDLSTLDFCQCFYWRETAVLSKGKGNRIKSSCKGAHRILLDGGDLICGFRYGDGATDIGSASAVDHAVVYDEITDCADSIVQGTFCFIYNLCASMSDSMQGDATAGKPFYCFRVRRSSLHGYWHIPQ
jgi:hypothetical protein